MLDLERWRSDSGHDFYFCCSLGSMDGLERFKGCLIWNFVALGNPVSISLTWYYKKEPFVISRRDCF